MTTESNNHTTKNYAYIDSQNLNMTIQNLGWSVDWAKFRDYLYDRHNVAVAYLFIGYIAENQDLYSFLQKAGFVIIFKPVVIGKEGNVKGNIDAELVLQVMIDQNQFDKAVIVTGDGDFHGLLNWLYSQNKLQMLLVPNMRQYSQLLKGAARDKIAFISEMRRELEYKKRGARTSSSSSSSSSGATTATSSPATPAAAPAPTANTGGTPVASPGGNPPAGTGAPRRRGRLSSVSSLEDSLMKTVGGNDAAKAPIQDKSPITSDAGKISSPPVDKPATPTPTPKSGAKPSDSK